MSIGKGDWMSGRPLVFLVGAGPGDPGLMSVRGLECVRAADVIVHDPRIPKSILKEARPGTEIIDIGRATTQGMAHEAISYLLADKAREGKQVVRLSWGDSFVFDRGGEEALYLREQGVPYEIVPGIPAAIAIPAYAGVPLSYQGAGDTITLVRGYEEGDRTLADIDWKSLASLRGTIVCYAYGHELPKLLTKLVDGGWPTDGQVMVVYNGTLGTQETHTGTATQLLESLRDHTRRTPAMLVAGAVVGFRDHLRWFDTRPLFGKRVLVTRPRGQAAELSERLAAYGAQPIEAPLIRIAPPEDRDPLRLAAAQAGTFDWIIFTSANAVDAFMAALFESGRDVRALAAPQLCAVGLATAERLARYSLTVDLVPDEFRAEAVVAAVTATESVNGRRILLPRADIGREFIGEQLAALGAEVTDVIAYRTLLEDGQGPDDPDVYGMLLQNAIDVVTFTSPSAVRNFARLYGAEQVVDLLRNTVVATIGPTTADAAAQLGITVAIQPSASTVPALVDAIAGHYASIQTTVA
jgi:uroporphyrinogen III methyltransferase/synthase